MDVCITKLGWTSRTAAKDDAGRQATAETALYVLFGRGDDHTQFVERNELYACNGNADRVRETLEWAKALQPGSNEYLATINTIATAGQTDARLAGYAASMINAYQRDCDDKAKAAKNAVGKDYIGKVGPTQDLGKVRIVRVRYYESNFGTKTIVAMEADLPNGSVAPITWFASGSKEFDENAEYTLRAGVKEHTDCKKWGKQTVVTRAKLTTV